MSTAVKEIIDQIERLPADERLELEERLAALFDSEWSRQVADARKDAASRGIDDAAIDRAIDRSRYGK